MSNFWVIFMGLLLVGAVRAENWEKFIIPHQNCDMNCTIDEIADSYIDALTNWWLEASIGLDTPVLAKRANQITKKIREIGDVVDEEENWFIQRNIRSDWKEYVEVKRYLFMRVNSALTWHMTLMAVLEKKVNKDCKTDKFQEKFWSKMKAFFNESIPLVNRIDALTCKVE